MVYRVGMALNRLRFHNILVKEMDAPSDAATELAEVVDEGIEDGREELGTKRDLEILRLRLSTEIQTRFNSQLRWIMVMWGSTLAAIVALAAAVIARG